MPILRVQVKDAISSTARESPSGPVASGALITPTVEGANVISAGFDINNRDEVRRVTVCARVLAGSPPASELDGWDTVEEVDIDVSGSLEIRDLFGMRFEDLSREISGLSGPIRLRVAARGRAGAEPLVHVTMWPSSTPSGWEQLRHLDGIDLSNFGSQAAPLVTDEPDPIAEAAEVMQPVVYNISPTEAVPFNVAWHQIVYAVRELPDDVLRQALSEAVQPTTDEPDAVGELRGWFEFAGGMDAETRSVLLPGLDVLTYPESANVRAMMVEAWDEALADDNRPLSPVAAVPAYRFVSEFVPIAERDGVALVVDTREGQFSGCVTRFDRTEADAAGAKFRSVSALLVDLSTALNDGNSRLLGARARFAGGRLSWDLP